MRQEEQILAIAEVCRWTDTANYKTTFIGKAPGAIRRTEVPDYVNDLNAMHGAVKIFTEEYQRIAFYDHLRTITHRPEWDFGGWDHAFALVNATAAQRAEAFLKTLNLWNTNN